MITVGELLHTNHINPPTTQPGRQYLTCPQCSALRKRHNQKKRCLSLMIEDSERAYWKCHHCGWSGPEKGSSYGLDGRERFEYPNGNFKVRSARGYAWEHEAVDHTIRSGAKELENILYRIDEAREFGGPVAVVEGEKDAETLWKLGVPAVTSANGAAKPGQKPKWNAEHSRQLKDLDIVVLNDNDPAGYAHANAVVECSLPFARSVRRLDLKTHWPGGPMPEGADISDYYAEVGGREECEEHIRELIRTAPLTTKATDNEEIYTAGSLEHKKFPEVLSVIPGLIIEGLTLLAAKPKTGKSWLALHAAMATAAFSSTLGLDPCDGGDVLYCALEDNPRRLQRRISKLACGWPNRLFLLNKMPRLASGGLKVITDWIASAPDPRMIIIDTLELVRERPKNDSSNYSADYTAVLDLRQIANDKHLAIVAIHHLRKMEADDPFDTVSGTLGLTGAVDAVLVLTRDGTGATTNFTLHGKGRDLEEIERPLTFDRTTCLWTITGQTPATGDPWARKSKFTKFKQALDNAIAEHGKPLRPWPDGPEFIAVDQDRVRDEFYKIYVVSGEPVERSQAKWVKFKRDLEQTQAAKLVGSIDISGTGFVWIAK